jgi:hypothetical protein
MLYHDYATHLKEVVLQVLEEKWHSLTDMGIRYTMRVIDLGSMAEKGNAAPNGTMLEVKIVFMALIYYYSKIGEIVDGIIAEIR